MHISFGVFVPLICLMIIVVMFIFSRLGWIHLSRKYGTSESFNGVKLGSLIGKINGLSYKNVVNLQYNQSCFYIYASIPFRLFHPPFKIPITRFKLQLSKNIFGKKSYYLVLEDVADFEMRLSPKQGVEMLQFLRKHGFEKIISETNH